MNIIDFYALEVGDLVRHKSSIHSHVVTGNYGHRVTAVNSVDITNSIEWELVSKACHKKAETEQYVCNAELGKTRIKIQDPDSQNNGKIATIIGLCVCEDSKNTNLRYQIKFDDDDKVYVLFSGYTVL